MRISDWSSDVCSSDLVHERVMTRGVLIELGRCLRAVDTADLVVAAGTRTLRARVGYRQRRIVTARVVAHVLHVAFPADAGRAEFIGNVRDLRRIDAAEALDLAGQHRSEEHKSELQSLMRNSYAGFC